jgi:amino acid permease
MYTILVSFLLIKVSFIQFPFYFVENYSWERIKLYDFNLDIIKFACVYIFAFSNHNAILNVISEVKNPIQIRGFRIINNAFYTEFLVYFIVLCTGYLSTFEETKEIFIDRDRDNIFLIIGKGLYIIALTCHIGLLYFISVPSLEMLINSGHKFTRKQ